MLELVVCAVGFVPVVDLAVDLIRVDQPAPGALIFLGQRWIEDWIAADALTCLKKPVGHLNSKCESLKYDAVTVDAVEKLMGEGSTFLKENLEEHLKGESDFQVPVCFDTIYKWDLIDDKYLDTQTVNELKKQNNKK